MIRTKRNFYLNPSNSLLKNSTENQLSFLCVPTLSGAKYTMMTMANVACMSSHVSPVLPLSSPTFQFLQWGMGTKVIILVKMQYVLPLIKMRMLNTQTSSHSGN